MTGFDWIVLAILAAAKIGFLIGLIAGQWGATTRADALSRRPNAQS